MSPTPQNLSARFIAVSIVVLLGGYAAVQLRMADELPFTDGGENLNVLTVLEMHWSGERLAPRLHGQPRIAKPPLTAWFTAMGVRGQTVQALSEPDPELREAAYRRLAREVRWPVTLLVCLLLLGVFDLGRTLGGSSVGWGALCVALGSIMLLRFGRTATTDVHLALWVTWCNALLARALLRGQVGWCVPVAGLCAGLALMAKGPVALLQTAAPAVAFAVIYRGRRTVAQAEPGTPDAGRHDLGTPWLRSVLLGLGLMLLVALPWPVAVLLSHPGAVDLWIRETTRVGATNLEPSPWFAYFALVPLMLPWAVFLAAGVMMGVRRVPRREPGSGLALLLLLTPILLMALAPDRKERYLLPMLAPAAVLCALSLMQQVGSVPKRVDYLLGMGHLATLAVIGCGLFVVSSSDRLLGAPPWYDAATGALLAVGFAVASAAVALLWRWDGRWLAPGTAAFMLALSVAFVVGYQTTPQAQPRMKALADAIVALGHTGEVYYCDPPPDPKPVSPDLGIYLARTVRVVPRPGDTPAGALVVMLQREGEKPPRPTGFTPLAAEAEPSGKRTWHVLRSDVAAVAPAALQSRP